MAVLKYPAGMDMHVQGNLSAETMTVPAAAIGNAQVKSDANIDATKLQHLHRAATNFHLTVDQPITGSQGVELFLCPVSGLIHEFVAGLNTAVSNAGSITIDLHKNGVTCLSAPLGFTSADGSRTMKTALVTVTTLAAGDRLQVVLTVTGDPDGLGPLATCGLILGA